MAKPITRRRAKQADHQRAYRLQQKDLRKPSRDDVARLALHLMINEALRRGQDEELSRWCETIVTQLAAQGFERDAAYRRVDQLIERYADGWTFQRKPHLARSSLD
ncbi:hypothetical protein ONR75_18175 [Rhodopseudomonas sp. P2A-2r]|uniref:hypothetical protein n=1 Tax=Rhodopseudomonas sp. P2A-2r TaxID=2991972 RepID=UPI00223433B2|nr:hypothetical protein [Rhodopseudomonas sp. P2A-2r]UZE46941.1 hypothetical protein ONR75_18175 [Rhodopseudomonas sp. P2A-2r]